MSQSKLNSETQHRTQRFSIALRPITRLLPLVFLLVFSPSIVQAQINMSGSFSPFYDGVSDPWHVGGTLTVGNGAVGAMSIGGGSQVFSSGAVVGNGNSGNGRVNIIGGSSRWENSGLFYVGDEGAGEISVLQGGTLIGGPGGTTLAYHAGSSGEVTISGTGSQLSGSSGVSVGFRGDGSLNILDGGTIYSNNFNLGQLDGASGDMTVHGTGSRWIGSSSRGRFTIGDRGTGRLEILDGGQVTGYQGNISAVGEGSVLVSGSNSKWEMASTLTVGGSGKTLSIEDGGFVSTNWASIGGSINSIVSVKGSHSQLQTGRLTLSGSSSDGRGELEILNGGIVNTTQLTETARIAGSQATITVDGAGSQWNAATVNFASGGRSDLIISNGGNVTTDHLTLGGVTNALGIATLQGNNSKLLVSDDLIVGSRFGGTGRLEIKAGSIVEVGDRLEIGNGDLVHVNGGHLMADSLNLNATSTFQMTSGSLNVQSIIAAGDFVQDGGRLKIGNSPGLLEMNADFVMQGGWVEFELAGTERGVTFDAMDLDSAQLDGTLEIMLVSGFVPQLGDTFDLIDSTSPTTGAMQFEFSQADLPSQLAWDTSQFHVDGTISVIASGVPEPTGVGMLIALAGVAGLRRRRKRL